jgi:sulfur carrier protein
MSQTLTLQLNGQPHVTAALTLADLIIELALTGKRYAIEIDGLLVPKSRHAAFILQADQKIEIVHAVGGG